VQVKQLGKRFGDVHALEDVSFEVAAGEWIAIMGPSGSGKTTLMNILGGLDRPTSGNAIVDGLDVSQLAEHELTRYRADKIGFVFQQYHLVPYLTAVENVMLAQYFHSITNEDQAIAALARVGLGDRLKHLPSQLSGGEQQRVAIARALAENPDAILYDEPTTMVDPIMAAHVSDVIVKLKAQFKKTSIVVTHDTHLARKLADRVIFLVDGGVGFFGTWQELENSKDPFLRNFLAQDEMIPALDASA